MREARIECLAVTYRLPTLGFVMRRGDVEHVPEDVARRSDELRSARKAGAVSVRYVERCKMTKDPVPPRPLPPSVRMSRPNKGGMMKGSPQPEEKIEGVSEEDIRRVVREEMRAALQGFVGQKQPINVVVDAKTISEALSGANPGYGVPKPSAQGDEPVYIPTDIVDKGVKADIKIEKSASKADSVDAAAAALKKTAPTKKRTPRKKRADAPKE